MLKDQMQFNPLYKLYYYSKSQMYDIDALQKAMKRIENLFIFYQKMKKAHYDQEATLQKQQDKAAEKAAKSL